VKTLCKKHRKTRWSLGG